VEEVEVHKEVKSPILPDSKKEKIISGKNLNTHFQEKLKKLTNKNVMKVEVKADSKGNNLDSPEVSPNVSPKVSPNVSPSTSPRK